MGNQWGGLRWGLQIMVSATWELMAPQEGQSTEADPQRRKQEENHSAARERGSFWHNVTLQ
jgi:hypothetical protein